MSGTDTVADVLAKYAYDPTTGIVSWRYAVSNNVKAGDAVGSINSDGYLTTRMMGKATRVHRLAWAIHNGFWPESMLDHINGIRTDNRIKNLRLASNAENQCNRINRNRHGYKGVSFMRRSRARPFIAQIHVNGRPMYLGCFATPADAGRAYDAAAFARYGEFARLNFPMEVTDVVSC